MRTLRRKIRNYFLTGLLVILPLFGSIGLLSWGFITITNLIIPNNMTHTSEIVFWRIVAFIVLIFSIFIVGLFAQNIVGRKLIHFGEKILNRIPLLNKVYEALKQISNAFWGEKKTILRGVVLVEYPRRGIFSIGFVTSETQGEVQEKTLENVVNIFIPTTPNPTSGILIMVPKNDVTFLEMSIEEGLKLVISGGIVVPKNKKKPATSTDNKEIKK